MKVTVILELDIVKPGTPGTAVGFDQAGGFSEAQDFPGKHAWGGSLVNPEPGNGNVPDSSEP